MDGAGATPGGGLVLVGLILIVVGLSTIWSASHPTDRTDTNEEPRPRYRRRIVGGIVTAAGVASVVVALQE
jgi:hypothetical protein